MELTTFLTDDAAPAEPQSLQEAEAILTQLANSFVGTSPPVASAPTPTVADPPDVDAAPVASERLRQTEARYRTLVEQIPAITFMASLDGVDENEIYVSPHIETMLGFTQAEWLGDPFLWHRQLHPDDRERWGHEFARTCASGVDFRSEYRFISRDGKIVWVQGEARVVRDENGRPLFLQGIAFDITESKRAEETLRRSAAELERKVRDRTIALEEATLRAESANKARASFLANMSHEIRTPLNAIIGFADLLRRGADGGNETERMEWLETIHSSGKHLLALINDILDLSKVDAGKLSIEHISCSPVKMINEVCLMLRSKAEGKGLRLEAVFDGPMPATIHSDPTRFRQLLMNLAGNAIKFTSEGRVRITGRFIEHTETGPKIAVDVSDTGIGIAEDKLDSIFDPFTQADSSITRQFGGTGLGLAISKRLSEAMGGCITVESQLGVGTTFTYTIDTGPLDNVRVVEPSLPAEVSETKQTRQSDFALDHRRILVVDDGETNRMLIAVVLGRLGAEIEEAEDGERAVARLECEQFDLVLMDMQMPVMDGYTATGKLREKGLSVPIIALTANAMKGDRDRCLEAGCSGYISKPIDHDVLVETVAAALSEHDEADLGAESASVEPAIPDDEASAAEPSSAPDRPVVPEHDKLYSLLPIGDPEFREIVAEFIERLRHQLHGMRNALAAGDFQQVDELAHWLKGSGGSVGFPAFTEPAAQLQQCAHASDLEGSVEAIGRLERLAERICLE